MIKISNFWTQNYRLDKMSMNDLWYAYFTHYTILSYLLLAFISGVMMFINMTSLLDVLLPALAAIILYPFAWYGLHRFVLHGSFLYRLPFTAKVWKRIHFDHHRDPHDLDVLFGALYTTLPTVCLVTMPVGWFLGGDTGMYAALCTGLLVTCFYEFCHCIQHLNYAPKWNFLQKMKLIHLRHHFHDENTNFGITNFVPDKIFKSYAPSVKDRPRSPTVFNLGYTGEEVRRYPWVARMTPDIEEEKAIIEGIDRRKPPQSTQDNATHQKS